tara:strand:- start:5581 stop:5757 length:177 start_codon:yes stop_codon:yes gene_type:complete
MGKMKELFTSMREGIMEGISIEKQMARRMADEQYRYSIYKKENTTKHVTNTTKNGKDK